jgi:hypothetical protein
LIVGVNPDLTGDDWALSICGKVFFENSLEAPAAQALLQHFGKNSNPH